MTDQNGDWRSSSIRNVRSIQPPSRTDRDGAQDEAKDADHDDEDWDQDDEGSTGSHDERWERLPAHSGRKRLPVPIPRTLGQMLCYIGVVSLFFSQTNYVPISAVLFALLPLYPLIQWKLRRPMDWALPIVTLYVLISAVLLDYRSLMDYEFFRRDGNYFVSFAPLLLLCRVRCELDMQKILRGFVLCSAAGCLVALAAWRVGLLSHSGPVFPMFFYAHNAAGGFLAIACGFAIALLRRHWGWGICAAVLAVGLFLSDSRGSIIGLAGGLVMTYLVPRQLVWAAVVVLVIASTYILYLGYDESRGRVDYLEATSFDASSELIGSGRSDTIAGRMYGIWPQAVQVWLQSPFVGTGFGSFNDIPRSYDGRPGLLAWSNGPVIQSDGHAHHSYVHILAEMGVVGLLLFCWLLQTLHRFASRYDADASVRLALLTAFWTLVLASFTEHRIVTPSNMLPFTLVCGLAVADANARGGEASRLQG